MDGVNWQNIAAAMTFYVDRGYTEINVPWAVSDEAMRSTNPGDYWPAPDGLGLVASAEQSFYQMLLDGKMDPGHYVACTPCFRFEDRYSAMRCPYFMKVELFSNLDLTPRSVIDMLDDAVLMMSTRTDLKIGIRETPDGFDLGVNGIEVGSYGFRSVNGHEWVYGTGIAEPRFSLACRAGPEATQP